MIERKSNKIQANDIETTHSIKEFILIGGTKDEKVSNFMGSIQQIFINDFDVIRSIQH